METLSKYKLIEGDFEPNDAAKILFALVNSKINYHSMDSFSNHIRFGTSFISQEKRIKELSEVNVVIKKLADYAMSNNKKMRVTSVINIELI
ncbi:MAG: hypothetical protein IPG89_14165 [Bacteroidetes bacterium]|nr:hypothetical protein [Bacteroidota bacterium]